jgi:hypothetical protein
MFNKEVIDSVVQELRKYAQDSQMTDLENLAKIAVFQDQKRKQATAPVESKTGSRADALYVNLSNAINTRPITGRG